MTTSIRRPPLSTQPAPEESRKPGLTARRRRCEELTGARQEWLRACAEAWPNDPHILYDKLTPSSPTWLALTSADTRWHSADQSATTLVCAKDKLEDEAEETPAVSAARALADLAAALAEPTHSEPRLEAAMAHYRRARLVSCGAAAALPDGVASGRGPVRSVLQRLDDLSLESGGYLALLALELAGQRPETIDSVVVPVLFDRHRGGGNGDLRLQLLARGPAGLHPDPGLMSFLATNDDFAGALRQAWALSSYGSSQRCVVWSVTDHGEPCNDMQDGSLGAAFSVALDELARRARRVYGKYRVRRLDVRCAVTGAVGADGRLLPVGGYPNKVDAAESRKLRRVVLPKASRNECSDELRQHVVRIDYAEDVKGAAKLARRQLNPRFVAAALAFLVVLMAGGVGAEFSRRHDQREAQRATAARVAMIATDLASGDEPTGLLLSMASDDLARGAGEKTHVFEGLAENVGTLIRIVSPPDGGRYEKAAMAADGRFVMVRTEAGRVDILNTLTGARVWSRTYTPGVVDAPGQVYVQAMTLSDDHRHAAFSTTDGEVHLLGFDKLTGWSETFATSVPGPQEYGLLGALNSARTLSFSADGRQLIAVGNRLGVVIYTVAGRGLAVSRFCPRLTDVAASVSAAGRDVLLASTRQVLRLPPSGCAAQPVFAVPRGTQVLGAYQSPGRPLRVVAGSEGHLQLYVPGRAPAKIADVSEVDNANVTLAGDDLMVTARKTNGTFGWHGDSGRPAFGFHALGTAVLAGDHILLVHDGVAELHTAREGSFGQVRTINGPVAWQLAWAGDDRLLLGRLDGVAQVRHPATDPRSSVLPESSGTADSLAGTDDGAFAAAMLRSGGATRTGAWNLRTSETMQVPEEPKEHPTAVRFAGSELLVGYSSGRLTTMVVSGGRWVERQRVTFPEHIIGLAAGKTGPVYVLASRSVNGPMTLTTLDRASLRRSASMELPGPGIGVLTRLSDGGVAVATGTGILHTYDSDLRPAGPLAESGVQYVRHLVEIPGQDALLVVGVHRQAVVRKSSMTLEARDAWRRAGLIIAAAASPTGQYLGTYNSLDSRLTISSVNQESLRARACSAIGRDLTTDEWRRYVGSGAPYRHVCTSLPDSAQSSQDHAPPRG